MLSYPVYIKPVPGTTNLYHDAQGQNFTIHEGFVYGVSASGKVLEHIRLRREHVVFLVSPKPNPTQTPSQSLSSFEQLSTSQRDKHIGMQSDRDLAYNALFAGS